MEGKMPRIREDPRRVRGKALLVNLWTTCQEPTAEPTRNQASLAKKARAGVTVEKTSRLCLKSPLRADQGISTHEDYSKCNSEG